MTEYVVLADGWTRVTEWTDQVPSVPKKWIDYNKGDVVDLNPDDDADFAEIQRLAAPYVTFRPALVEKAVYDEVDRKQRRAAEALTAARAATISSPYVVNPQTVTGDEDGNGPYPEGSRTDTAPSTVGSGGTDPEPGGFSGESGQAPYEDTDEWPYSELQAAARARGLSAGGSRADIVNRLLEFDERNGDPLSKAAAEGDLDDEDKSKALRPDSDLPNQA